MDSVTLNFQDGATVNIGNWENKDGSSYGFELGSAGFSTLTGAGFLIGNGNIFSSTNGALPDAGIQNATYGVDMASYTGGTQVITLVDYTSSPASVTSASFQTATLAVNNAGG